MEPTIHPHVIKGLMARRNLTQEALKDLSGVGIATIKRICSGKGMPKGQRRHTLDRLAKALGVELDVLTAKESPPAEVDEHLRSLVYIKASVNRQIDLSFKAVEAIYGISRSAQISMAPLFAALIAEASLKWRQGRLDGLGTIADRLDAEREDNPLLNAAFQRVWEAEKIEKQSIQAKDVLGHAALEKFSEIFDLAVTDLDVMSADSSFKNPRDCVSPFLSFLKDFSASFGGADIKVESSDPDGDPHMPNAIADYTIGEDFMNEMCGNYGWARIAVEYGHVSLSEIPRSLLTQENAEARKAFIASQMTDAKRREHAKAQIELQDAYEKIRSSMYEEVDAAVNSESQSEIWTFEERVINWIKREPEFV